MKHPIMSMYEFAKSTNHGPIGPCNEESCQSPIEIILMWAVWFKAMEMGLTWWACGPMPHGSPRANSLMSCEPQFMVGSRRVDFRVCLALGTEGHFEQILVECDGHEWHEKTKEQAAHDKARERELVTAGYKVLRFTGSEIFREPIRCAEEVVDCLFGYAGLMETLTRPCPRV